MKKRSFFLIPILSAALLLNSCGQEPIKIEIGKEFKIENNPITILKFEEMKVLRSEKEKMIKIAPKGKKYIYLEVKNPKDEMIFLKVFSKDKEIKAADDLMYFGHDIDTGFEDAYFLVDENTVIDKIVINTPADTEYTVINPAVTKDKSSIPDAVYGIIDAYTTEKPIGLLEGFAPYVEEGKNVHSIATQDGEIMASNIMSNKAELSYFTEDGKTYVFRIQNILGSSGTATTHWQNGKITSIEVVE